MSRVKRPLRFTDRNQACFLEMSAHGLQEKVNETTVQYVGGGFGPPKTEGFLPIQQPEKNKKMSLFDLQTVAFWV
jgi:hypothetical protein